MSFQKHLRLSFLYGSLSLVLMLFADTRSFGDQLVKCMALATDRSSVASTSRL